MDYSIYYAAFALLVIIVFALAGKWAIVGLKVFIAKLKYKENAGFIFLVNKSGIIGFPHIIDLRKDRVTIKIQGKKQDYAYNVNQVQHGRMFGLPYIMYYVDDSKTSVGWYFHQSEANGNPMYYDPETKQVPVLSPIKDSVSLTPSFFEAIVGDEALTLALRNHEKTNNLVKYLAIGSILAAGFAAYTGYEMISTHVPAFYALFTEIKTACLVGGNVTI